MQVIPKTLRGWRGWAAAGTLAVAGLVPVLATAPAGATISPSVIFTPASGPEQGVAGLAMRPNVNRLANGDKMTGARSTTFLRKSLTYSPGQVAWTAGALCEQQSLGNPNTAAAIIFARWTGTTFNIYAAHGNSANCLAALNGVGVSATLIDQVPLGHNWFGAVTQDQFGAIHFTSADTTADTVATDTFGGFNFIRFTRAFTGTAADTSHLTTPLSDTLAVARSTAYRDSATNTWVGPQRANLTRLVGNRVVCSTNGGNSGAIISPQLTPTDVVRVLIGGQSS